MAKYLYTYSGSNAAFIFAGVCTLPAGIAVSIEADQHKALQKNKFAKHLLDIDELAIEEIADDSKPTGRGRGANKSDLDKGDTSKANVLTMDEVRKALTDLDITYADDETVEQLQAKLTQATE